MSGLPTAPASQQIHPSLEISGLHLSYFDEAQHTASNLEIHTRAKVENGLLLCGFKTFNGQESTLQGRHVTYAQPFKAIPAQSGTSRQRSPSIHIGQTFLQVAAAEDMNSIMKLGHQTLAEMNAKQHELFPSDLQNPLKNLSKLKSGSDVPYALFKDLTPASIFTFARKHPETSILTISVSAEGEFYLEAHSNSGEVLERQLLVLVAGGETSLFAQLRGPLKKRMGDKAFGMLPQTTLTVDISAKRALDMQKRVVQHFMDGYSLTTFQQLFDVAGVTVVKSNWQGDALEVTGQSQTGKVLSKHNIPKGVANLPETHASALLWKAVCKQYSLDIALQAALEAGLVRYEEGDEDKALHISRLPANWSRLEPVALVSRDIPATEFKNFNSIVAELKSGVERCTANLKLIKNWDILDVVAQSQQSKVPINWKSNLHKLCKSLNNKLGGQGRMYSRWLWSALHQIHDKGNLERLVITVGETARLNSSIEQRGHLTIAHKPLTEQQIIDYFVEQLLSTEGRIITANLQKPRCFKCTDDMVCGTAIAASGALTLASTYIGFSSIPVTAAIDYIPKAIVGATFGLCGLMASSCLIVGIWGASHLWNRFNEQYDEEARGLAL